MQGLLVKIILIEIKIEQKNYSGFFSLQHLLMNSSNFNYTLMTPGTLKDLLMNSKQFTCIIILKIPGGIKSQCMRDMFQKLQIHDTYPFIKELYLHILSRWNTPQL